MFFSKILAKKNVILGVDIGTSNIKIAQISHENQLVLDTYGMVNCPYQLVGKASDDQSIEQVAKMLKVLVEKSGVTTKRTVISFPNSAVFTSVIQLPKMNEKEMGSAVEFEAKKYVPLALEDIDLSWTAVSTSGDGNSVNILLTAVPKQVTQNYVKVFSLAGLEPEVGEIEALALIRSLIGAAPISCVIIDVGARSTGLNIIEKGFLRLSRNLNIGGDTITTKISQSLNVSLARAEQFKKDFGVSGTTFIPESIKPILNLIKAEVRQLLTIYQSKNEKVDKIILVGGGSNMPGIAGYFEDLQIPIELGDPLKAVGYNQGISEVLKRYSLNLPIAIGLALRQLK